jgi:hypothetical protein
MSDNNFYAAEAGKVLGDMLAANTVLKELDLSKCNMRAESTRAFAVGLSTNGALTSLNVSKSALCGIANGFGAFDASGVTALAEAIGKHE